jgi:hypothetical protein
MKNMPLEWQEVSVISWQAVHLDVCIVTRGMYSWCSSGVVVVGLCSLGFAAKEMLVYVCM